MINAFNFLFCLFVFERGLAPCHRGALFGHAFESMTVHHSGQLCLENVWALVFVVVVCITRSCLVHSR